MNKELELKNGKLIVTNEFGKEIEREFSSNIEQILITENNIEEINTLIEKENKTIIENKSKLKSINTYSNIDVYICLLWTTSAILHALSGNIFSTIVKILCSGVWFLNFYSNNIKHYFKDIKTSEKSILLLEKELDLQNQKLNVLEKEKNNDCNYVDTSKKHFHTSDKILELKNKLMIIEDYMHNKSKYIKYYKKGILSVLNSYYNNNNLLFIEELIKNDLENNTNIKTKEKQKTLTK